MQCPARLRLVSTSVIYCHRQTFYCRPCRQSPLPPVAPAASRSGRPDIGVACHPVHRDLHLDPGQSKQAAPGAACCKKKTKEKRSVTSQSPGHLQLVALARSRQASSLPAL